MKKIILAQLISLKNSLLFLKKNNPQNFSLGVFLVIFSIAGTYLGIWKGLAFIVSLGSLGTVIIKKIIFILFFILFFMIAISFGIFFYGAGFKSKETAYLFSLPFDTETIIFYKFLKSTILASWIPFLGIILFFLAYSVISKINLFYPLFFSLYILPFLILACFLGYVICMTVLRFLNFKKFIFIVIFVATIIFIVYSSSKTSSDILYLLSEEIAFLKIAQLWFLPFSWPAYGFIYLENEEFFHSFIYLLNLWSLSFFLLGFLGNFKKIFSYIYHYKIHSSRKIVSFDYVKSAVEKLKFLSYGTQQIILKDMKLFFREPALCLQFLVFFGILFFYFLNLRRFSYHLLKPMWKNLLTFLNTFSILCISSAMCIRFIFPQWSLEGKNFWLIKLSPLSLNKIYRIKEIVANIFLLPISGILIFVSNYMLNLERFFFLTIWIVLFSTFMLISVALGLGAYFADFKEEHYLKAVESVGGFLTLVINFAYIFLTLFIFGSITHLYYVGHIKRINNFLFWALSVWMGIGIFFVFFFKRKGLQKLERKEF